MPYRKRLYVKFVRMSDKPEKGKEEEGTYIYRMTITVKGKVIRRANGRPFKILVKN